MLDREATLDLQSPDRLSVRAWPVSGYLTSDLAWAIPTALVARLAFWWFTQRVWEDALITVAHARNAAEGLGLTRAWMAERIALGHPVA